ncbi:MAG: helix-turn-helix transcriptional regulator [Erysipelotrichales bacterium]|nr:helix-turn-helix transcriptional regulator [Erysipelotrichales bacterium]
MDVFLADNLKIARKDAGLSQEELADMIRSSRSRVSAWEIGKDVPSRSNVELLAEVLGKNEDYFFGTEEKSGETDQMNVLIRRVHSLEAELKEEHREFEKLTKQNEYLQTQLYSLEPVIKALRIAKNILARFVWLALYVVFMVIAPKMIPVGFIIPFGAAACVPFFIKKNTRSSNVLKFLLMGIAVVWGIQVLWACLAFVFKTPEFFSETTVEYHY